MLMNLHEPIWQNISASAELKKNKIVFLSPHLDDIAFSLGGAVASFASFFELILLNIFSETRYLYHKDPKNSLSANEIREAEDRAFSQRIGAKRITLGFPDTSVLKHTSQSEFITSFRDHRYTPVKKEIEKVLLKENPDIVFCPLGLGGHIDHRIVFHAIWYQEIKTQAQIYFYEDLPYTAHLDLLTVESIIQSKMDQKGRAIYFNITDFICQKEQGISLYKSQLETSLMDSILTYAKALGKGIEFFERSWF